MWILCVLCALCGRSRHKLFQKSLALAQRALAVLERSFEGPVLDFDAHRSAIASVGEGGEEAAPVDVAQSRQLGCVPAQAKDAARIDLVLVKARVLGV